MRFVISTFWLAVLPLIASAHHSRAEFSEEIQELEGEIVGLFWENPHPHVAINVVNSDGTEKLWRVEMWTNLFSTERAGVMRDSFNEGDLLTVAGQVSTRRDGYMLGNNLLFEDGWESVLNPRSQPRWTDRLLSSGGTATDDQARRETTAEENRGIFRVWTPTDWHAAFERQWPNYPFTEAALAAQAEWDELDNFLTRCEQPGMPWTVMVPQEYEFVNDDESIQVHAQYFDTTRTIHMQNVADPKIQRASHLGYSVGRWEGTALIIETTRINWPFFDFRGTPQSEAVHVIERYQLSDDQSRLNVQITVTDPLPFAKPVTFEVDWLALGRTIREYNCQIY